MQAQATGITKDQAMTEDNFHENNKRVDRKGHTSCYNWRRNGATKTWKRAPHRFQIPVKYGLRSYGYITETNAHMFHLPGDAPCKG